MCPLRSVRPNACVRSRANGPRQVRYTQESSLASRSQNSLQYGASCIRSVPLLLFSSHKKMQSLSLSLSLAFENSGLCTLPFEGFEILKDDAASKEAYVSSNTKSFNNPPSLSTYPHRQSPLYFLHLIKFIQGTIDLPTKCIVSDSPRRLLTRNIHARILVALRHTARPPITATPSHACNPKFDHLPPASICLPVTKVERSLPVYIGRGMGQPLRRHQPGDKFTPRDAINKGTFPKSIGRIHPRDLLSLLSRT